MSAGWPPVPQGVAKQSSRVPCWVSGGKLRDASPAWTQEETLGLQGVVRSLLYHETQPVPKDHNTQPVAKSLNFIPCPLSGHQASGPGGPKRCSSRSWSSRSLRTFLRM